MAILNVTYNGRSQDIAEIDLTLPDADVKRVADEIFRTTIPFAGMCIGENPFEHFVVDRFDKQNRIYLRPKVPFGT